MLKPNPTPIVLRDGASGDEEVLRDGISALTKEP
jgi:hypothetical protein